MARNVGSKPRYGGATGRALRVTSSVHGEARNKEDTMPDSPAYRRLQKAAAEASKGAGLLALRTLRDVHWECIALEEEWRGREDPGAEEVRAAIARIRAKLAPATTNPYGGG
jgi:hypothetical protein